MICPYSRTGTTPGVGCSNKCARYDPERKQCYDITAAQALASIADCLMKLANPLVVLKTEIDEVVTTSDPEVVETDDGE